MRFANWTDAEIQRWLLLRAIEWNVFPAFVSQPLVPIIFLFFSWYWVIAAVVILNILWSGIRYSYVNITVARMACLFVAFAKWPFAIGSAIYLFINRQFVPGFIALFWPLLAGLIPPSGKIGVIELAFAKKIGYVPENGRPRFPGITENGDGTISFSLTDEEQHAIDHQFTYFKDIYIHPDAAERVQHGIMAVALSDYAKDLVRARIVISEEERKAKWPEVRTDIEKAIAAMWKAYSLSPLPIYLYHRGSFLAMLGVHEDAHKLFTLFVKEQSTFNVDDINKALINREGTNLETALSHARDEQYSALDSEFKRRSRITTRWFHGSKKNESVLSRLSNIVFEKSLLCAEVLKPDLEKKFGKDSKEFHSKYVPVLFEFMYFFLHLTDRYAFAQLGNERRNKLIDELVPPTIDATIETYFGHWPKNLKDGIEKDFYSNLNNAQIEYGSCKELLLDPKDDTPTLERIMSGTKSKSMVGQLTDNLSQIIEGEIGLDPFFPMMIWGAVIESLKKKEIQDLISEASNEIK